MSHLSPISPMFYNCVENMYAECLKTNNFVLQYILILYYIIYPLDYELCHYSLKNLNCFLK